MEDVTRKLLFAHFSSNTLSNEQTHSLRPTCMCEEHAERGLLYSLKKGSELAANDLQDFLSNILLGSLVILL